MMNNQAIFAQMSSSMDVTKSAAYDLSESFTMLGADIASLFNIDVESAYQKLQSALSGQARAMRKFGVDISVATMQEKAYALGINKSVTAMTQAEKAQLRYIMNAAYKDMVAGITDSIGSKSTDILESWRVSFAEFKAAWGGECQKTLGIILNIG